MDINLPDFNSELCTGCGRCVTDCPKGIISLKEKKAVLHSTDCLECSHCFAVCPENAVSFSHLEKPVFQSFTYKEKYLSPDSLDSSTIVNIIRSRKSVRKYQEKEVSREILNDLVAGAVQAPSGSNMQQWHFTILDTREKVWNLALEIRSFFEKMNRYASNPFIRYGSVPFMGKALVTYHREYMPSVTMALEEAAKGNDLLFHGAPALVIFHAPYKGSTPREDSQYASYSASLLAHAMGLGTCYIGYAVESINRMSDVKAGMGIPAHHRINAVLTVGYPRIVYARSGLRKPVTPNFI
jgi:nitroreductase/NAD-dependent dihydropyrimidine dehydrogenase PreA subunit